MPKATDAFRTISEVADDLDVPKHVLRFWEMRFPQIKPMKRGGGRRYYRPADIELLRGIRHLLHAEGYTIKGVQRILRDQGPAGVQRYGQVHDQAAVSPPAAEVKIDQAVPVVVGRRASRRPEPASATDRRRVMTTVLAELEACRTRLAATLPRLADGLADPKMAAASAVRRPRARSAAR